MREGARRLQNRKRTSLRAVDVARLAGCSTATVSRVQNTPHLVAEPTRQRVEAAIRELGYLPNGAARALRSERSQLVGAIIPTLNHAIHATFVEAAQVRLAEEGYALVVGTSDYDLTREAEQAGRLVRLGIDGLILVGNRHERDLYELLDASGVPHVNTYVYEAEGPHPSVGIDNRRATYDLASYLLGMGHRTFGVISAAVADNDRARDRVEGVRSALREQGLSLPSTAIVQRGYSIASGREGLRILRQLDPAPTAILCGNDVLAHGALIECRKLGLAVPRDVSVTGFDDLDFTAHLDPALTTMAVPARDMGARAAAFLLDTLHERPTLAKVRLEPDLIVRGSTGPARQR